MYKYILYLQALEYNAKALELAQSIGNKVKVIFDGEHLFRLGRIKYVNEVK